MIGKNEWKSNIMKKSIDEEQEQQIKRSREDLTVAAQRGEKD